MSIFDKFNDQGMGDKDAFEELCCQLFEMWGQHHENYGDGWAYRNIRGTGGDGGVEAYWHDTRNDDWVGLQAKWFPKTITDGQCQQLADSVDSAMSVRPTMARYIICIPHNLTSKKRGRGGKITIGEDERWQGFVGKVVQQYPALTIELWDENEISNQLQRPENEGRRRFWFDHSLLNPENIELSLEKTIEALKSRYIPDLTDDGGTSDFLDEFFGTRATRLTLVKEVDGLIVLCDQIVARIASLAEVGDKTAISLKDRALACAGALSDYSHWLSKLMDSLAIEPAGFLDITSFEVDYAAIEGFSSDVYDAKRSYQLPGHIDELDRLLDKFRDTPSPLEITNSAKRTLSEAHCIIEGDQGTGKTCGLANKARDFQRNQQHVPVLVLAASVKDGEDWWRIIADALGVGSGWDEAALWQALSSAAALHDMTDGDITMRAKVAVLVDGLDERPPSSFWEEMIKQGDAISRRYPRVRFAYSSRPSGTSFNDRNLTSCFYSLDAEGDVPAYQLFDRYIEHYDIDLDGNNQLKWLLRTPMELRMFCTAHQSRRVKANVSACLTDLVAAEIDRLEDEFAVRNNRNDGPGAPPVRKALLALARAFLDSCSGELTDGALGEALAINGLDKQASVQMTELLLSYGVISMRRTAGYGPFDPGGITYAIGTRHLWDYFMAVLMIDDGTGPNGELLARRPDSAEMFSILLVEMKGVLPLNCESLVTAMGERDAYDLTLFALSYSRPEAAAKFRPWVLDEMRDGYCGLPEVVNGLVIQVANVKGHPLGPTLLDKVLRTFDTPVDRDAVLSLPVALRHAGSDYQTSLYWEHDSLRHLPRLHEHETSEQMPLVLAWGLFALSNLKRRHCRNELVKWGLSNPAEFAKLFRHFYLIDDPQIREDMFAIAEEVVCQGTTDTAVEAEIGRLTLESVFSEPDGQGNRNAALRFYGRILVERCCRDGLLDEDEALLCRPPYDALASSALPIFPDACKATAMSGYWPIHYDLARYVLVDRLTSTFGIHDLSSKKRSEYAVVQHIIDESASLADVETPSFEGWVIAAAYQYLLDHGYDPETLDAEASDDGERPIGVDRAIRSCFHAADHGDRSTVMTIAEKYVWCAFHEICGYIADRVPVYDRFWYESQPTSLSKDGFATDYGMLLSFDSPLFEATVLGLKERRDAREPSFPSPFSCDESVVLTAEAELRSWILSADVTAATILIDYQPDANLSIAGDAVPLALFANDWGVCGKESRAWIYAGVMDRGELDKLKGAGSVALDGYDRASSFQVGYVTSASYISPVEAFSSPWMEEYDEPSGVDMVADAHINAKPLSGEAVASLIDSGDYFYDFPSSLARTLCPVTRTDGCRYYDSNGRTRFEYVDYGTPYRHDYRTLLADKDALLDSVNSTGGILVWYATIQRDGTNLARERIPGLDDRVERSWIIWRTDDGYYASCPISEKEQDDPQAPSDNLIKNTLSSYGASCSVPRRCLHSRDGR